MSKKLELLTLGQECVAPQDAMKILHIGPDSQFIQFIASTFEYAAPNSSDYAIVTKHRDIVYPLLKGKIYTIAPSIAGACEIALLARKYDVVIAHGLIDQSLLALLTIPRNIIRVWSGWGFDYYSPNIYEQLAEKTAILFTEIKARSPEIIGRTVFAGKLLAKSKSVVKSLCIGRIDYFSAPIPNDLLTLKKNFPRFRGEYCQLNYGNVEDTFSLGKDAVDGCNILLGNSASITNNHLDAFERLKKVITTESKIIVPLSYGDEKYRDVIIKKGKDYFGESFCPITKLLPLSEYSKIISSCQLVVMAHKRQQALGNICSAMYKGARVLLDEENPIYQFFISRGAIVNSLHDLANMLVLSPLSEVEICKNKEVIKEFWGQDTTRNNTKTMIDKIYAKQRLRYLP